MGKEILTYDDLLQIVELIKSAEAFSEFHLKIGDIELDLRKSASAASSPSNTAAPASSSAPASAPSPPSGEPDRPEDVVPALGAPKPGIDIPDGSVVITSPMVGTFYRSPEPGASPLSKLGRR